MTRQKTANIELIITRNVTALSITCLTEKKNRFIPTFTGDIFNARFLQ